MEKQHGGAAPRKLEPSAAARHRSRPQAVINNRKQKIIPSYELEVKLNWEGSSTEGAEAAKGKVRAHGYA